MTDGYPLEGECPLCDARARRTAVVDGRPLLDCEDCGLLAVPRPWHVSPEEEHRRYLLHRNSLDNEGYRRLLEDIVKTLRRVLPPEGAPRVVDYGSGPTPALVSLLRAAGYTACGYDPFFEPLPLRLGAADAVVSVETFEHFRMPRDEVPRVLACLRPHGWLVVRTALRDAAPPPERWHYVRDETHVAFYAQRTFAWMAERWGLRLVWTDGIRLIVLQRMAAMGAPDAVNRPQESLAGSDGNARASRP